MKKQLFIFAISSVFLSSCFNSMPTITNVAPSTTSNAESLTRETNEPTQESYPRVSPDGKTLLYYSADVQKVSVSSGSSTGSLLFGTTSTASTYNKVKGSIIKKDIGSATRSPLVQDAMDPAWLPDGSGVIFTYVKPTKSIIVKTSANGVGLNYVSQGAMGENDGEPSITKDGKKVIFTTAIGGHQMICSMNINGGSFTVITEGTNVTVNPNNNEEVLYNLKENKRIQIYTFNLSSGQKTQITSGDYDCRDATYSADGNWIAYSSNQEDPSKENYHIFLMRRDGTDIRQLTKGNTNEGDVCWAPDGYLYFYSNAGNNYNIWKVKPILK